MEKMKFWELCLVSLLTLGMESEGLLWRNKSLKTKKDLDVSKETHPGMVQEYELLLQVIYQHSAQKRKFQNFLKDLKPQYSWPNGTLEIIRKKATTYCSILNGTLRCACEDGYHWFSHTCLDPRRCHLNKTGAHQSCDCRLDNLHDSINFCERTKIFGTFKIREKFRKDLLNSSSILYSNYTTGIEIQLKEAYKWVPGFDSVRVTQFREGSIVVGYEIVGSSHPSELLAAVMQVSGKVKSNLKKFYLIEESSFRVFEKADCDSIVFGFGSENNQYTLPCSAGYVGNITARCHSSAWQLVKETCVPLQLEELRKNLSAIQGNITEAAVSTMMQELSTIIQKSPSTTAGSLGSVVSILRQVSSLSFSSHVQLSAPTTKNFLSVVDHLLNSTAISNWTVLLQEERNASSQLLETLEDISTMVPSKIMPLMFSGKFINWNGILPTASQKQEGYNYWIELLQENSSKPIRGTLSIGKDQFQKSLPQTIISMSSLTLGSILSSTSKRNATVNGPVISAIIPNYTLDELFLIFSKIDSNLSKPYCVFWDFRHLEWNDVGCQLLNETHDTVMCRCTHLTSFSMLMSPYVPPTIIPVVKWITYVGLSVSIVSLVLCLVIEVMFWKQVKKNQTSYTRHICMVNVALSLLIADIWFIVAATSDAQKNASGVCVAAVFFTHFFYLSLFFWMLTLGILIVYRIVLIFHHMTMPTMMAIGFSLGYGCPLLITIITIAATQPSNSYRRKDVCWLNWSDNAKPLLAFVVPALTIVVVNLMVVLVVLLKLQRPTIGERLSQDDKVTAIRIGKTIVILTPLLGLTWGFGIGTIVDSQSLAWHIIFALLNAFQGFFILCFGVIFDSKVRQLLFKKLIPISSSSMQPMKSTSDLAVGPKFLKTFNPLHQKGTYTLSGVGESTSDIMLTQFLSSE
ncbi:adhesion G-protein coupled receptor F1 isoform X1 [Vombatus ursinus]|uniref:Adhesion G protein-coupled receptor F1 n=1 Tax=Vombatus ursinus TaxID=29139 RepID=A0A4X2K037_VOMUR|nr:adhesion G-protein coupled receptor F1 isoform X1 [Vombatus ursinus]XP_027694096.1 adhesion G-protein coupled receptor F1 isoform X1 [Vombatus ursinus]